MIHKTYFNKGESDYYYVSGTQPVIGKYRIEMIDHAKREEWDKIEDAWNKMQDEMKAYYEGESK